MARRVKSMRSEGKGKGGLGAAGSGMADSTRHHGVVALHPFQEFALDHKLIDVPVVVAPRGRGARVRGESRDCSLPSSAIRVDSTFYPPFSTSQRSTGHANISTTQRYSGLP